jgi:hypothetical protein
MSDIIFYIAESTLLSVIFYLLYISVLSKETFFQLNRVVLLAIPILSLFFPMIRIEFVDLTDAAVDQPLEQLSSFSKSYYDAMASWEFEVRSKSASSKYSPTKINWFDVSLYLITLIYMVGVLICFSRTVWSIRWIVQTLVRHPIIEKDGVKVIRLVNPTAPFSFLNYLFVHAPLADSSDFRQILAHERTHIEEKHTLDLLYIQIVAAFMWFNPVIWLLLKSLKTTHEYIADRKIIQSGYSVVEYQTLLLRQLISNNSQQLVHNFNLSFIKKRITMMTNKKSGWLGQLKVSAAIIAMICCSVILIRCNSKIDDEQISSPKISNDTQVDLPTLPSSAFRLDADLRNAVTFTISNNTLHIGDKESKVSEIANLLGTEDEGLPIIMMVDKNQQMGFVRKVHLALRKANRRKLLYVGETTSGERVEVVLMLPPHPDTSLSTDDVPKEHLLKINLGDNEGIANQQKVYDFIMSYVSKGNAQLAVVSAVMDNAGTFGTYLLNFFYVKEGYIKIYQERAQTMYGKDFYQTSQEEYNAVREKIPTNISIAED